MAQRKILNFFKKKIDQNENEHKSDMSTNEVLKEHSNYNKKYDGDKKISNNDKSEKTSSKRKDRPDSDSETKIVATVSMEETLKRRKLNHQYSTPANESETPSEPTSEQPSESPSESPSKPPSEPPSKNFCTSDEPKSKKLKLHHFKSTWLVQYNWLQLADGKMLCKMCSKSGKTNTFTVGCTNFRKSTLDRHVNTDDHQNSIKENIMRPQFEASHVKALTKNEEAIVKSMRNVYFLAKKKLAMEIYPDLQQLLQLQGVNLSNLFAKGDTYSSVSMGNEFLEALSTCIKKDVDKQLSESQWISILIDESTDITVSKKLLVYSKFINENSMPCTVFLGNLSFEEAKVDSEAIFNRLTGFLQQRNIPFEKIIGFGSDGASVMTGRKKGVDSRLKNKNPFCLQVHCMAHRLNLVTSQAAQAVPLIASFQQTLGNLFYYFRCSSSRVSSLKALQKVLDIDELKIKEVHEIRWSAFHAALDAVYRSIIPLIVYFKEKKDSPSDKKVKSSNPANEQKPKATKSKKSSHASSGASHSKKKSTGHKTDSTCKSNMSHPNNALAKDMSKQKETSEEVPKSRDESLVEELTSYRFIAILHYLMDIIPPLATPSLVFQKDDIDIAAFTLSIDRVIEIIERVKKGKGTHQTEFINAVKICNSKCTFKGQDLNFSVDHIEEKRESRAKFCDELLVKLRDRFPRDSCVLVNAFDIFGMRGIDALKSAEEVNSYGKEKLDTLIEHYCTSKIMQSGDVVPAIVDEHNIRLEWDLIKQIVLQEKYYCPSTSELWQKIAKYHSAICPNLLRLAEIALVMPLQTAAVERGFSVQNIVHTKHRNRLNAQSVDDSVLSWSANRQISV